MPRKTFDIQFPAAGVVRRAGVRASTDRRGPYPAPWATNVRLEGGIAERLRGGSFTGISAAARPSEILYRDRVLTFSDNAITATRLSDHDDTKLSVDITDTLRATLFQLSLAGEVGGDVVALIPHKDQSLLGFTAGETWILGGDPNTGTLRRVSPEVGIIGADAWCMAHDTAYFLSSHGLYSVGADGSNLKALSEDRIPEDLTGVTDSDCTLTYDHATRGVYIHITDEIDWFYDIEREGFWPFTADTTDSHVVMGPFRLGRVSNYGRALNLHGNIAAGSADVDWRLVTGDTAEAAAADAKSAVEAAVAGSSYSSYVVSEGTWSAGRAHMAYPRCRAIWCCLWLHSTGSWSYENAVMTATVSGKWS